MGSCEKKGVEQKNLLVKQPYIGNFATSSNHIQPVMQALEYIGKLPRAPLQEVIFEAHWALESDDITKQPTDKGFALALGVFAQVLAERGFTMVKRLVPEGIPLEIVAYKPVYQFRRNEGTWPVVQFGFGIITVNDTEQNYEWNGAFKPLIEEVLEMLTKSYRKEFTFSHLNLRYIDAVDIDEQEDIREFISKNLQIQIRQGFSVQGRLSNLSLNQSYVTDNDSHIHLSLANGINAEQHPALLWQTSVERATEIAWNDVSSWLDFAHTTTSHLFRTMLTKEFYEQFT